MKSSWLAITGLMAYAILSIQSVQASTLADDLIGELYTMRAVYRAEYAPAHWKKSFANYDLNTEFNKAVAAVQANPNLTLRDAREILKQFIYAMKDYHTSISFVSTELATLPFSVSGTDSKVFITYIDRSKLPESSFPFHIGDELVTFDGKPAAAAVAEVQAEIPANVPATDKALAEMYLTKRSAARGYRVPQGTVMIGVKPAGSNQVAQRQLIWDYTPERIHPRGDLGDSELFDGPTSVGSASAPSLFHPQMNVRFDSRMEEPTPPENPTAIGARRTFTPALGPKIWQSADSDFFDAYIYKTDDRRLVGYIRIASYVAPDYIKAVAEFAKVIGLFETSTDAMVIDQVNNPGGSVFYLYALASMLATQPLHTPLHHMAINQADVADADKQITLFQAVKTDEEARKAISPDMTDGYPASYEFAQFMLNYARFIVSEWDAGRKLTRPYWIGGVDHINPAPTHYSKPILLLTNNLDFSGGDFFPAILQDNKRVTIFGSRTAGAGGYVNDYRVSNNVGVDRFRCTESIAERVNHDPIENLGIKPDIEYNLSESDFAKNYVDYVKAIQAAVAGLLK